MTLTLLRYFGLQLGQLPLAESALLDEALDPATNHVSLRVYEFLLNFGRTKLRGHVCHLLHILCENHSILVHNFAMILLFGLLLDLARLHIVLL